MITLYYTNGTIPDIRVTITIEHLKLCYQHIRIFPLNKSNCDPTFISKFPQGKTPALIDSSSKVEMDDPLIIIDFLIKTYGSREDINKYTQHTDLINYLNTVQKHIDVMDLPLNYKTNSEFSSKDNNEKIKTSYQCMIQFLNNLNKDLSTKNIMKNSFQETMLISILIYLVHRGLPLNEYKHIKKYYNTCIKKQHIYNSIPHYWNPYTMSGFNTFRYAASL